MAYVDEDRSQTTPGHVLTEWLDNIGRDCDLDNLLAHIRLHFSEHMPPADAPESHWTTWLAGSLNLFHILLTAGELHGMLHEPTAALRISRLFRKWRQHPFDHTGPPEGLVEFCRNLSR